MYLMSAIFQVFLVLYSIVITVICLRVEIVKYRNKMKKELRTAWEVEIQRKQELKDFVLQFAARDYEKSIQIYIESGSTIFEIKECHTGLTNVNAGKLLKIFNLDKEYWQLYKSFFQNKGWFIKELHFDRDYIKFEMSTEEKTK